MRASTYNMCAECDVHVIENMCAVCAPHGDLSLLCVRVCVYINNMYM